MISYEAPYEFLATWCGPKATFMSANTPLIKTSLAKHFQEVLEIRLCLFHGSQKYTCHNSINKVKQLFLQCVISGYLLVGINLLNSYCDAFVQIQSI